MANCQNCGFDVGDSKFCPNCGQKVVKPKKNSFCPNCGEKLEENSKFCPNCGFSKSNESSNNEKDLLDNVMDVDEKISGKFGGLFSKSKAMGAVLDKTASYRYNNLSKKTEKVDRSYFERLEPVFLEVYDSIEDEFVKDVFLVDRTMMGNSGGIVGAVVSQVYTPTKDMNHDDAIRFYQNIVEDIVADINHEKQNGTFDEEEFYKKRVKKNTIENVSLFGFSKSIKHYKRNKK